MTLYTDPQKSNQKFGRLLDGKTVTRAAQIVQPFREPTRTVRLLLDRTGAIATGSWRPRTFNYAAEIHDLVHSTGSLVGGHVTRIGFRWNKRSIDHRHLMASDDVLTTGPALDQPRDEMRLYGPAGRVLHLKVIPPCS